MPTGFVITAEWTDGADEAAIHSAHEAIARLTAELAEEKGLLLTYLAMNFAHSSQKVLQSYGAENVKFLKETASKYDPEGLFQRLQNNDFLLRDL